jgi:ATP-dependent Clp protease ATP-binding subunit ClpA
MFERFTKAARRAVEDGVRIAKEAGAAEVRPDHMLSALLADERSTASRAIGAAAAAQVRGSLEEQRARLVDGLDQDDADALRVIGIDLEDVVRRMDALGGRPGRRRGHLPFTRSAKKALELALREAIRLGDGFIGTEHLLLGVVRGGERSVLDALWAAGLSPVDVRTAVEATERRRTG